MEDPRKKMPSLGTSGKHPLVPVKAFMIGAMGIFMVAAFLVESNFLPVTMTYKAGWRVLARVEKAARGAGQVANTALYEGRIKIQDGVSKIKIEPIIPSREIFSFGKIKILVKEIISRQKVFFSGLFGSFKNKRDQINANIITSVRLAVAQSNDIAHRLFSVNRFATVLSEKISSTYLAGVGILGDFREHASIPKKAVERIEIPLPTRVALWNKLGYRLNLVGNGMSGATETGLVALVPGLASFDATGTIVSFSAEENTLSLGRIILGLLYDLKNISDAAIDNVFAGWGRFLGTKKNSTLTTATSTLNTAGTQDMTALKEQIKREVYEQLKREMLSGGGSSAGYAVEPRDYQGLVVYPADATRAEGGTEYNDVRNSFSDKVQIKFDPNKRSGIITPIFRNSLGKDYIFVITPISSQ